LDLGRRTGNAPGGSFHCGTAGVALMIDTPPRLLAPGFVDREMWKKIRPQSRLRRIQIPAPRRHRDRHAPLAWPRRCRSN